MKSIRWPEHCCTYMKSQTHNMMDLLLFLSASNINGSFCKVKSFIIFAASLLIMCSHSTNLSDTSRHQFHFEASLCISQSISFISVVLKAESICWELILSSSEEGWRDKYTTWKLCPLDAVKEIGHDAQSTVLTQLDDTKKVSIFPHQSLERTLLCYTSK